VKTRICGRRETSRELVRRPQSSTHRAGRGTAHRFDYGDFGPGEVGQCLRRSARSNPGRGIAEGHLITSAAGLAAPVSSRSHTAMDLRAGRAYNQIRQNVAYDCAM